ncbi:hypothetical protein [Methanobacterium sp. ACI-7]|uniref:hypothetical protein n=1 Tax=unclassified Methanobacterium TaxID=2627676 RepID=UPI0039C47161
MKNHDIVNKIMKEFGTITGLEPDNPTPKRYLWTDSFAVCNYIGLFNENSDKTYLDLALKLVNQVHHTLGKHRNDDPRKGWISGLSDIKGKQNPTKGGLRIGKSMNERKPNEPINDRLEWDQDGQYYHYLTKWMHALNKASIVTEDVSYVKWAFELAKTAHKSFTYDPGFGQRKRMYWKMSIDLSYALVPSMGQHDPLDGFVTYNELQMNLEKNFDNTQELTLQNEIREMSSICKSMNLVTSDPLGIGGLLFDGARIAQIIKKGNKDYIDLLKLVLKSAKHGVDFYANSNSLMAPVEYRLAFRELGFSIGLKGINHIQELFDEYFNKDSELEGIIASFKPYLPIAETINEFWMDQTNQKARSWVDHKEINMVMLATSLAPDEFIII